jgi:hypothetical protein
MVTVLIVLLLSVCIGPDLAPRSQAGDAPTQGQDSAISAPDSHVGYFDLPDGTKFRTTLYELKVIGQIHTNRKLPYFILAGRGCEECDANTSIYIHSPSDGPMKHEGEQTRFPYPGRQKDYETGQFVYEARMFYGNCAERYPNAVLWFERSLGADRKWHQDVVVARVKDDQITTEQLQRGLPKVSDLEGVLRTGQCHELPGVDGYTEP